MIERLTADLIVLLHLGFIVFVVFGGVLTCKWPKVARLHIPCALWGVVIALKGWICPLTFLELYLRKIAGEAGYGGGFVEHYVMPIIYPAGLTRGMQISFGAILLAVNLCVYGRMHILRKHSEK